MIAFREWFPYIVLSFGILDAALLSIVGAAVGVRMTFIPTPDDGGNWIPGCIVFILCSAGSCLVLWFTYLVLGQVSP